jgi:methionyl-tRNA formyltransferase
LQCTLPIAWTDTYGDVLNTVIAAFPDFVAKAVRLIANDQVQPQVQAHLPGTYFAGRGQGDEWLDWSDSSRNLYNKIRAITHPGPGARTLLGDEVIIIWRAFYDPSWPTYMATPGQVVGRRPGEGVIVKTGDSTLLVQEVQIGEDETRMPTWRIGTRLGINLEVYLQSLRDRIADLEQTVDRLNRGPRQ